MKKDIHPKYMDSSIEPILDGSIDELIDLLTGIHTKKAREGKFKEMVA